jgi:hypothetical protein
MPCGAFPPLDATRTDFDLRIEPKIMPAGESLS